MEGLIVFGSLIGAVMFGFIVYTIVLGMKPSRSDISTEILQAVGTNYRKAPELAIPGIRRLPSTVGFVVGPGGASEMVSLAVPAEEVFSTSSSAPTVYVVQKRKRKASRRAKTTKTQ